MAVVRGRGGSSHDQAFGTMAACARLIERVAEPPRRSVTQMSPQSG
jgi:hypothetical protein